MRQFNKMTMTLFDSTNAHFRLAIEADFTRRNEMGGYSPLVFVTNQGNGSLNPNIYLLFTYKGDTYADNKTVYMSYPQLYDLRKTLDKIKDEVEDNKGFLITPDKVVSVRPEYAEPLIIDGIDKQAKSISFKLVAVKTSENGISNYMPAVSIQLSDNIESGFASALSVSEILTIWTLIHDLNLAQLQATLALAFLESYDGSATQPVQAQQPAYMAPNYSYGQQPTQPVNYTNNSYYQNGNNQQQYRRNNYRQTSYGQNHQTQQRMPNPVQTQNVQTMTDEEIEENPVPAAPRQRPAPQLKPRPSSTPSINLNSVDNTQVSSVDYDDTAAIDEIFNSDKPDNN